MAYTVNAHVREQPTLNDQAPKYYSDAETNLVLPPRLQMHPTPVSYWAGGYPFINRRYSAVDNFGSGFRFGLALSEGMYNPNTYTITGVPSGYTSWDYLRFNDGSETDPNYFGRHVLIRWTGNPNAIEYYGVDGNGASVTIDESIPNRILITWDTIADVALATGATIRIVAGDVSDLLVCRASDEAKYDAGQLLTDEAIAYYGVANATRLMQIQNIHPTHVTKAEHLCHYEDPFWGLVSETNHEATAGARSGFPLRAAVKMCKEIGNTGWICMPAFLGASPLSYSQDEVAVSAIDYAALGTSDASVFFSNTTEIRNWCDDLLEFMGLESWPVEDEFLVTIGNEIWNWSFPYGDQTHFYNTAGATLPASNTIKWKVAYGYQAAKQLHMMQEAIVATAGTGNDRTGQNFRVMLEYQAASPNQVDAMAEGIALYEADAGISLDYSYFEVSPSNYVKGIFSYTNSIAGMITGETYASSEEYYIAMWDFIDNYPGTDEDMYDEFRDYLLKKDSTNNNTVYGVLRWSAEGYQKALTYGFGIGCCYEGGSHEDGATIGSDFDGNDRRREIYRGWLNSPQHAEVWETFYKESQLYFSEISNGRHGVSDFYTFSDKVLEDHESKPWFEIDEYSDPDTPVLAVNKALATMRKLCEPRI